MLFKTKPINKQIIFENITIDHLIDKYKMNSAEDPYARYVSFEEMVTYAYSITAFAKKIRRERVGREKYNTPATLVNKPLICVAVKKYL